MKHWSPGARASRRGPRHGPRGAAGGDNRARRHGACQLVLEDKLGALAGDRVILRDPSAIRTMAGAAVIDPAARAHRRSERRLADALALAEPDTEVLPKFLRPGGGLRRAAATACAQSAAGRRRQAPQAGGARCEGRQMWPWPKPRGRRARLSSPRSIEANAPIRTGLSPERLRLGREEALATRRVQGACSTWNQGPRRCSIDLAPAPPRPFDDAQARATRTHLGVIHHLIQRALQAAARARHRQRLSDARALRCASSCSGWPRSAASSRRSPRTTISCGPWSPR